MLHHIPQHPTISYISHHIPLNSNHIPPYPSIAHHIKHKEKPSREEEEKERGKEANLHTQFSQMTFLHYS
jgi:hypothetical protein